MAFPPENILKCIVAEASKECFNQNISIDADYIEYYIKHCALDPNYGKYFIKNLPEDRNAEFIKHCIEKLSGKIKACDFIYKQ